MYLFLLSSNHNNFSFLHLWLTVHNLQDWKGKPKLLLPFCLQWHHGPIWIQRCPCGGRQTGFDGTCEGWLCGSYCKHWRHLLVILFGITVPVKSSDTFSLSSEWKCVFDHTSCSCHHLNSFNLFFSSILNVTCHKATHPTTQK